jgi:hypothetical protein
MYPPVLNVSAFGGWKGVEKIAVRSFNEFITIIRIGNKLITEKNNKMLYGIHPTIL